MTFIVVMFVVTSMVRESNDKVAELLLSLPSSRTHFVVGKTAGYVLVALIVAISQAIPLALIAPGKGLALWTASLMIELAIVAAASLFCVLSLTQTVSAIAATTAFYLLARSIGTIQLIAEGTGAHGASLGDKVISSVVAIVTLMVPSLDSMTQSSWLFESPDLQILVPIALQGGLYALLLSAASLFDISRKNL